MKAAITLQEFDHLRKTALLGDEDIRYLKMSHEILKDQTEAILDVWYGFVGANPHLLHYFTFNGEPSANYLSGVRGRFGQWILATSQANYDQKWLDYQIEIGVRHHRSGKNKTDNVKAVDHIHFRYLIPLIFPIVHTLKPFLERKGATADEVEKMQQAWLKSVLLQITLWSYPYVKAGDF